MSSQVHLQQKFLITTKYKHDKEEKYRDVILILWAPTMYGWQMENPYNSHKLGTKIVLTKKLDIKVSIKQHNIIIIHQVYETANLTLAGIRIKF